MNRISERSSVFKSIIIGDVRLLHFIYSKVRCKALNIIMPQITKLGSAFFTISIGLLLTLFDYQVGIKVLAILGASHLAAQVIKKTTHRLRPYEAFKKIDKLHFVNLKDCSFPSGHTTASFALAVSLSFYFPSLAVLFIGTASLVGISRVYLGVHYPSDVIIGALIGILFSYMIF